MRAGPQTDTETVDHHWLWIVLVVGALFGLGVLGRPLVTGEIRTATDLGNFHLPIRVFYAHCLAEGWSFVWFPHEFTGFYVHGEGQAGLFHPLNWISYRVLPLAVAFDLELLRSYVLLWLGGFWLLRRWELPREAAGFGAFLFSFCGFVLLHYVHLNIVAAAAHLPFLLLALDWVLRPRGPAERVLGPLAVMLLTASQLVVGHPQIAWISGLVEGACALAIFLATGRPVAAVGRLASLAGAKLLGVAGAGIALMPLWDSLGRSFRAAPPQGFTQMLAIDPAGLVQLVAPYLHAERVLGENTAELALYLGAVPLVLSLWVLVQGRRLGARWPLAAGAGSLFMIALLLCLGDRGGLYSLQGSLPLVGLFRAPARYVLVLQGAVAVLSAVGIAALLETPKRRSRWDALVFLPFLASLLVVAVVPTLTAAPLAASWLARLAGPLLVGGATLLVVASARGMPGALVALVVFAMTDLAGYGLSFVERAPPTTVDAYLARFDLPLATGVLPATGVPPATGVDRLHWGPPALTIAGIRLASGYAAMPPDRVLDLGYTTGPLRLDARLRNALRVSGVRWAIGTTLPRPLPRARLVTRATFSSDINADIAGIDVATTALIDEVLPAPLSPGEPGLVEIRRDDPGDLRLAVNAPGRQLLVVSESYHPGWRVDVDARPAAVVRTYGDYLGVVVEGGHHEAHFRFEPASLRDGGRISGAALIVAFAWTLVRAVRGRGHGQDRGVG